MLILGLKGDETAERSLEIPFFEKSRGAIIKIFKNDQSKAEGALKIFMMEYNHGIRQRTKNTKP